MKANTIRKILQDPRRAAQELQLPLRRLQEVRRSWIRRLASQCGACGQPSGDRPVCRACFEAGVKITAPGRIGVLRLLRELDPEAALLTQVCRACGRTRTLTARQVVQQYRSGPLPLEWECTGCRRSRPLTYRPFRNLLVVEGSPHNR